MPFVGDKFFPYTAEGNQAAMDWAQKTGQIVEHRKGGEDDPNIQAAAEQQQGQMGLGNERMDAAINPVSPFGDSSQGMGQGRGMGGGY